MKEMKQLHSSSSKATISQFAICTGVNILLLFTILVLVARTVLLPQSLIYDRHLSQNNEIRVLLQETSQLLQDLADANMNLPSNVKSDIQTLRQDITSRSQVSSGSSNAKEEKKLQPFGSQLIMDKIQKDLQNCTNIVTNTAVSLAQCRDRVANAANLAPSTSHANNFIGMNSKWLVIGIPTVGRPHNEDYLLQTLQAMADQFPDNPNDILYHQILVVIVDVQSEEINPKPHKRFEEAKTLYSIESGHSKAGYFRFIQAEQSEVSLALDLEKKRINDVGNANTPGKMVRKQTRDIALVLRKSVDIGKCVYSTA